MRERWEQLTRREQWVLMVGGVLLLTIVLLRFIWWPLIQHIDRLHEDIDVELELIEWMAPRIAKIPQGSVVEALPKSASQLERSMKDQHIQAYVEHFAVGEQGQVNITLQAMPVPLFMTWMDGLMSAGWQVKQATLTPAHKPGVADVEMILE